MKPILISSAAVLMALSAASVAAQDAVVLLPPEVAQAEAHILLVRHAYNECGDLQCDLTKEGYRQADEFARIVSELSEAGGFEVAGVFASSACRTVLTVTPVADDAGLPVQAYPASGDAPLCAYLGDGDGLLRPDPDKRPDHGVTIGEGAAVSRVRLIETAAAYASRGDADASRPRVYLVADHSNYVCEWAKSLNVPVSDYSHDCGERGLEHTDFADIYWLYDSIPGAGAGWRMMHFENAFDRGRPNPLEMAAAEER